MSRTTDLGPGWRLVRFGDVVRQVRDRVDPVSSGIERYVAGEHMDTDDLRIHRWGLVGDGYLGPAFTMHFMPGQVLYGSRRTYLRKVAVPDFEGICANTTFVLEPSVPELLPEFLPHVMTTEAFHEHSIQQSKGSVNPYINFSDLKLYEFALPPLDEQRRITVLLDAMDLTIESYSSAASAISDWVTSYFAAASSECALARLGDVADIVLGRQRAPKYESGPNMRKYIRAANVKQGRLVLDDVLSMHFEESEIRRLHLQPGDVLVTEGCGSLDEIGANAVWNDDLPGEVCFQNTVLRLRSDSSELLQEFLQCWASQAFFRGEFSAIASGTSIYHLGAKRTAELRIPLPRISEQELIVERVQAALRVGTSALDAAERLRMFRRDVLRNCFDRGGDRVL